MSASCGRPPHDGVDVHLLERDAAVLDAPARHDLEPLRERGGLGPVVRLQVADDDVDAVRERLPALEEHAVRLADSGGHAQQDPVTAAHAGDPRRPARR